MEPKHKSRGFTLIELMIVVAILAVLAAVAIPSYNAYIRQSHTSEATSMLANIKIKQESYRSTFHQYADLSDDAWQPDRVALLNETAFWTDPPPVTWRQLGIKTFGDVYYIYTGSAGAPGAGPPDEFADINPDDKWSTEDFWYGAKALQNFDGGDECEGFIATSGQSGIMEYKESCPI